MALKKSDLSAHCDLGLPRLSGGEGLWIRGCS